MRYLFAAGILATAEFAAPYPIQCCARLSGAPNLIMRVFSRKHVCTRSEANWQPSCAIAGFLRTTRLRQVNMCLQARKHICKRKETARGSKKARLRESAQARDRAKQIACGRNSVFFACSRANT